MLADQSEGRPAFDFVYSISKINAWAVALRYNYDGKNQLNASLPLFRMESAFTGLRFY